jgi:hypothetical protein
MLVELRLMQSLPPKQDLPPVQDAAALGMRMGSKVFTNYLQHLNFVAEKGKIPSARARDSLWLSTLQDRCDIQAFRRMNNYETSPTRQG